MRIVYIIFLSDVERPTEPIRSICDDDDDEGNQVLINFFMPRAIWIWFFIIIIIIILAMPVVPYIYVYKMRWRVDRPLLI